MALSQKLVLKQGQSLVMTPQLQQAIKLLQMSNVDLQSFIETELERNPLLERDDASARAKTAEGEAGGEPSALDQSFSTPGDTGDSPTAAGEAENGGGDDAAMSAAMGMKDSGWASLRPSGHVSFDDDGNDAAALITREETLIEHLSRQLNLLVSDEKDRAIGQFLIGMVNEAGYLTGEMQAVSEQLGCSAAHLERVIGLLQGFEPAGVFARNLGECLKLQLKERNRLDPAISTLIDHLPLVARRDFQKLKTLCNVSLEDVHEMISEIKSLNPKPGNAYGSDPVAPVIPDVNVRAAPDGSWIVELNSDTLPRVLMNTHYAARVVKGARTDEDKVFLSEAQAQANWLIKSLDQRARTILKVAKEIVAQQDAFLVHGIQHLKPLNLRTVADSVEMHESTISRVTSNKYMATPRGVFELKFFFTNAIASATGEGEGHSSESVRHRIKELISKESPESILSDDTLVDILQKEGIDIARRTVAKYRESLHIPSSIQRRRDALSKR